MVIQPHAKKRPVTVCNLMPHGKFKPINLMPNGKFKPINLMSRKKKGTTMKYASPLFIVKNQCEQDLYAVLEKVKKIGFDGVEFLGFFGKDVSELACEMQRIGLAALGNHVEYEAFRANPRAVLDAHKALGCRYVTITGWFGQVYEEQRFHEWAETVKEIGRMCRAEGVTLLYHNHHSEYRQMVKGEYLQDALLNAVPADALAFEPDLGWMAIAGASPLASLQRYKDRCPVLHLKDYYATTTDAVPGDVMTLEGKAGGVEHAHFAFRPTGYGIMNYPLLVPSMLACQPEWVVLDHDLAYGRDPYQDLADSLAYAKRLFSLNP